VLKELGVRDANILEAVARIHGVFQRLKLRVKHVALQVVQEIVD
jgi:hypothetical protein